MELTPAEAADMLGISEQAVRKAAGQGKFAGAQRVHVDGREVWRIPTGSVGEYRRARAQRTSRTMHAPADEPARPGDGDAGAAELHAQLREQLRERTAAAEHLELELSAYRNRSQLAELELEKERFRREAAERHAAAATEAMMGITAVLQRFMEQMTTPS